MTVCLAVPGRVIEKGTEGLARVDLGGIQREVSLDLLPDVEVGDYVIIHVGFAIERLDAREAEERLALLTEAGILPGELSPEGET